MIGTVVSCTLVAYGFARFRFPGRNLMFTLLIATIFLPAAVTLIPTYTIFAKLGWVNTWLPLLVPAFFANAYDVFLLRQYLLTIPRDLDEAATIDGAGPIRILRSVVLPQAWPVIIAVSIFHFVYAWNDFFGPLIYLSGARELQPLAGRARELQRHLLPEPGVHPGRHDDDAAHPGHPLRDLPAGVHARHRHHRRGEVVALRVALTFDAEHPDRPGDERNADRILDALALAGVRTTFFVQGRWAEAVSRDGPADRQRRPPRRQPLLLPRPDAPPVRRRPRDGCRGCGGGDPRARRSRPAALVPLPVRGRRGRSATSLARLDACGYREVGWDVSAFDWEPDRTGADVERLGRRRCRSPTATEPSC